MSVVAPPKARPAMMRIKLKLNTTHPLLAQQSRLSETALQAVSAMHEKSGVALPVRLPALGAVEKYPRREIVGELHEAMLLASSHEQHVARSEGKLFGPARKASRAGCDDVDLVAGVRMLPIAASRRVQLHRKRTVPEQLHGALAVRAG